MTVPVQTPRNSYTADGINDTFAFTFRLLDNADLKVTVDGVLQVESTDYTIQNLTLLGGDVVFEAGSIPINSAIIEIIRDTSVDQQTAYSAFDPFPAETHELGLDKLTMIVQELKELVGGGSVGGGSFDPNADQLITGNWRFTKNLLLDDANSVARNAGYRNPGIRDSSVPTTILQSDGGQIVRMLGGGGDPVTVPILNAGTSVTLLIRTDIAATDDTVIEDAGVSLVLMDGNLNPAGTITLQKGAVLQLYWESGTTVLAWGTIP